MDSDVRVQRRGQRGGEHQQQSEQSEQQQQQPKHQQDLHPEHPDQRQHQQRQHHLHHASSSHTCPRGRKKTGLGAETQTICRKRKENTKKRSISFIKHNFGFSFKL